MAYGREILHGMVGYVRENGPWTVFFGPIAPGPRASLAGRVERRWHHHNPIPPVLRAYPEDRDTHDRPRRPEPAIRPTDGPERSGGHRRHGHRACPQGTGSPASPFRIPAVRVVPAPVRRLLRDRCAAGFPCDEYLQAQAVSWGHQLPSWEDEIHRVAQWIASRPKPLGLMACNDFRGVQLRPCRAANVAVPEEVAVIGVDNETLACELAHPSLSSVIPDCRRIGYEAAKLARSHDEGRAETNGARPGPSRRDRDPAVDRRHGDHRPDRRRLDAVHPRARM